MNVEQRNFLFPKAYNAALRAGAAILDLYNEGCLDCEVVIKKDYTPITEADRRSHAIIKDYLATSHVPLLSEEGREMLYLERMGWDMFWLVDPLDGTKEFIKGNGEFTINIALMENNRPVLSVVYVPHIGKIYLADSLRGSFLRSGVVADSSAEYTMDEIFEGALALPVAASLNDPIIVAVSRSHNTDETFAHIEQLKKRYPGIEVIRQGSSFKFCLLAEGAVDYYVRTSKTYEWDTAAGELILSLSGGTTRSLDTGEPFSYNKENLENPYFVCRSKFMAKADCR